jgi:hypothetical protein
MAPTASEFTPELSSDYLASLLNPIEENERKNVGTARQEGAAAGLVGQAAEGSRIGAEEENAGLQENSAINGFNLDVANKQYGERMTDEAQSFQDTERQKTEAFQQQMEAEGFAHEDAAAAGAKHAAEQGQLVGGFFGLAGSAAKAAGASAGGGAGDEDEDEDEDED